MEKHLFMRERLSMSSQSKKMPLGTWSFEFRGSPEITRNLSTFRRTSFVSFVARTVSHCSLLSLLRPLGQNSSHLFTFRIFPSFS